MITKLYASYDLPFDHDVCHLFEHIVLQEFLGKLRIHGYDRPSFGWTHGQTVDSTIFFELGVYRLETVKIFEECLAASTEFSDAAIARSVAHIEAEMRSEITIKDKKLLLRQLQELALRFGQPDGGGATLLSESSLKVVEKPSLFREIVIMIALQKVSLETRKAFMCLYPVLLDIVQDAAIGIEAAYPVGISVLETDDRMDGIGIAQKYSVKKSVDLAALEDATRTYVRNYDAAKYMKYIGEYQKSFANDSQYNFAPIRFYYETGIKTTREELAQLITPERLQEIFDKTLVRVEPLTGDLEAIDWRE